MKLIKLIIRLLAVVVVIGLFYQFPDEILAIRNPGTPTAMPTEAPGNCICGHPNVHLLTCVPVAAQNHCRSGLAPSCVNGPLCNSCSCLLPPSPTPTPKNGAPGGSTGYVAQDPYCTGQGANTDNPKINSAVGCIPVRMDKFIEWFLPKLFSVMGGISFLLIIYGFIAIALSEGDPKKVQAAKDTITSAIIGLVFAIFALFILRLILIKILQIPGINKNESQTAIIRNK